MNQVRKIWLISMTFTMIGSGVLAAVWSPVSAGIGGEPAGAYIQYLPIIHGVNCVPGSPIPPDDIERDIAVEARINEIRDQNSLTRYTNSPKISQTALRHSNDMADNDFFGHTGSDGSRAGDRLDDACYDWLEYGEIIAAGYRSPSSVVAAWMGSEDGHRDIILDDTLEDFGAGYAYNGSSKYKHYWTVDFGLLADDWSVNSLELHTCSYHLQDGDGEMWVSLHTGRPCQPGAEEAPGQPIQE